MLNKLLPKQVAAYWDSIKHGIQQSCPSDTVLSPDGLNKYLIALMSGELQCWMVTDIVENKVVYYGNVVTKINRDPVTNLKTLLIVSLYMFQSAPDKIWEMSYKSLEEFGKANECKKITAYTTNERVVTRGNQFGFDTQWIVLAKDI